LQIERRTVPGETDEIVERQLRELVGEMGNIRIELTRQPFEIAPDAELVTVMQGVIASHLGAPAELTGVGGWMDSALTSAAGIPTVIFGPTGEGAHADVEWIDLETVASCRAIYADLARTWCR
ncbi:MAG: M20/M25/M40 family metallo-hydrolase, partial [Chloroflexota bacterium]|nr:M20/M25/M40 family metallo-hydrolase [Chloroflexota bacterium]